MAKKAELLEQAKELGLELSVKNTIAEISEAIESAKVDENNLEEPIPDNIEEVQEKLAEEVAEIKGDEESEASEATKKPKKAQVHVRAPRKRGKRYQEAAKAIEANKEYALKDAVALLPKTKVANFDPSVEIHIKLGVDPKNSDEMVRGSVSMPHGIGKDVRVAALVLEADAKKAITAGADIAGEDKLLESIAKEQLDFDVLIATPELMSKLGQHAKVLGPKGLMPNPKSGTVNKDFERAIKETKAGKVEFRIDSYGIIHSIVGKLSFGDQNLLENLGSFVEAVRQAKPTSMKKTYIETVFLTTSMGPSIKIDLTSF